MSLRSLLCRVIGHRWDVYSWVRWNRTTGDIAHGRLCLRCGLRQPFDPSSPSQSRPPELSSSDLDKMRWLIPSEDKHRGTADMGRPVRWGSFAEDSTRLLDQLSALARGGGGSLSFTLWGVPFACSSSTGAPAPTGASSTSTPTPSSGSDRSVGEC